MSRSRLLPLARIAVVAIVVLAIAATWITNSFADVSATGRSSINRVPTLFKDKEDDHGNGNGNGNGNGQGNGNGHEQDDRELKVAPDTDNDDSDDDGDNAKDKKDKKEKKDKSNKSNDDNSSGDDSDETPVADDEEDDSGENGSGNVDCGNVDSMVEYLIVKNMNGAVHANENGADNAALGALNKCKAPGQNKDTDSNDTPVVDGSPVPEDGDDVSDNPVTVEFDLDEDDNGTISYDLDGDGIFDLIMYVKRGIVIAIEETGSASDGTPVASPEAA